MWLISSFNIIREKLVMELSRVNMDELRRLMRAAEVVQSVKGVADDLATDAQRRAPRDTGAGAASIRAERVGTGFHVSWDAAHSYMVYPEMGTRHIRARPFLRPAADRLNGRHT